MSTRKERGITPGTLTITLIAMAIVLILAMIKIYLSNRIYYESRQVSSLERQVAALKEESTILHMRVEKLTFKNQIADTIFTIDNSVTPEEEEK